MENRHQISVRYVLVQGKIIHCKVEYYLSHYRGLVMSDAKAFVESLHHSFTNLVGWHVTHLVDGKLLWFYGRSYQLVRMFNAPAGVVEWADQLEFLHPFVEIVL